MNINRREECKRSILKKFKKKEEQNLKQNSNNSFLENCTKPQDVRGNIR